MRLPVPDQEVPIRRVCTGIVAAALLTLTAASATAQPSYSKPQVDRTPATCDQFSLVFHRHRARVLLKDAYDQAKPDRSLIAAAQRHARCIESAKVRRQIHRLRVRLKERAKTDPSSWCAPHPAPDGGGCWVIPAWCVDAESGGSWTAHNPSSPARGPYQLLGHGEPWPVTTRAQAMEHHRIAANLYASQGLGPWVAC